MGLPFTDKSTVAQWVKRWPADLAVPSSNPEFGNLFTEKGVSPVWEIAVHLAVAGDVFVGVFLCCPFSH